MGQSLEDQIIAEVISCQGPPICLLTGDAAIAAAASCPWCKHFYVMEDGAEYERYSAG